LPAGDRERVAAMMADGWIGFAPGVAQAANVGLFSLHWVQKGDTIKLEGACSNLPVVANLPPTACLQSAV